MSEKALGHNYYPRVTVDLSKLRNNVDEILKRCNAENIQVAGVIKGCTGLPRCAQVFADGGCSFVASSRLEQIRDAKDHGVDKPFMLIRIPMKSEIPEAIRLTDISLNSEVETLKMLDAEAGRQGRKHKVILMIDLGDLREGFWDKEELLTAALMVEKELTHLELAGVGTNLGCYGSINATADN